MNEPNEKIIIYDGPFQLTHLPSGFIYKIWGEVAYSWTPKRRITFKSVKGNISKYHWNNLELLWDEWKGPVKNELTKGLFLKVKGEIESPVVLNKKTNCEKISFDVPNLRNIGQYIIFKVGNYEVELSQRDNYTDLQQKLKAEGGYLNLYTGTLKKGGESISFDEATDILEIFGNFLTFVNGYRTSAMFRRAAINYDLIWYDFTHYPLSEHKCISKLHLSSDRPTYSQLWLNFFNIYNRDKVFLKKLLDRYLDSISISGTVDDLISKAQSGLELLYNWLLVEQQNVKPKRGNAAEKIRSVLSEIKLNPAISTSYHNLVEFVKNESKIEIKDGPSAIVYIRNPHIHPDKFSRDRDSKIDPKIKQEALDLAISYLQLAIIYILR